MLKGDIKNLEPYFDENNPIEDDCYNAIKDLIKCEYCAKILKDPMMCNECQRTYCNKCIDKLNSDNHDCKKLSFFQSMEAISLLNKLKYLCKNCKSEIKKENIETHLKEVCIKKENPSKLKNEIYKKKSLQKLTRDEIKKLKKEKVKHKTCKKKKFFYIIFLL